MLKPNSCFVWFGLDDLRVYVLLYNKWNTSIFYQETFLKATVGHNFEFRLSCRLYLQYSSTKGLLSHESFRSQLSVLPGAHQTRPGRRRKPLGLLWQRHLLIFPLHGSRYTYDTVSYDTLSFTIIHHQYSSIINIHRLFKTLEV